MEYDQIIKLIDDEVNISWKKLENKEANVKYYQGKIIALETLKAKIMKL